MLKKGNYVHVERKSQNEQKKLIVIGVIVLLLLSITTYRKLETQPFAHAIFVYPPDYINLGTLSIYSEEEQAMISVKTTTENREKFNELIITAKTSKHAVKKPSSTKVIVEQTYANTTGLLMNFTLHQKNNDYYVAVPTDIYVERIEWYKLKGIELPEFYFDLLKKPLNNRGSALRQLFGYRNEFFKFC